MNFGTLIHQNSLSMHKQIILLLFFFTSTLLAAQNANPAPRVSFTLSNPSLRTRIIDIRYYGSSSRKQSGYGYEMGALHSHAVNMPAGTFIYEKRGQEWKLKLVIHAEDQGRKFDLSKSYEISREEWLASSHYELNEETAAQEKLQSEAELERITKIAASDLITFKVGGKSLWGKQAYVRAEIPGDEQNFNNGFSRKLSWSSVYQVSYPKGTKLYLCEEPYWKGKRVKESLFLVVDAEKTNYLIRI